MKLLPAVLALYISCLVAAAQTPVPTPAQKDNNDVVKISTNLIQLDVTITDKGGKPIADIRPDEIEIYENGVRQKITGFSFVSSAAKSQDKQRTDPGDKNAIPVPQRVLRPEQVRRTVALVVDDLSLSFESAHATRVALKKFVDDQMQPGDLVAIIRSGAGVGALQQFTSDKRILYAAIERVKWNPLGKGGVSAFAPLEPALPPVIDLPPEMLPSAPVANGNGESLDDFRGRYFATGTLGALRYVVNGMSELPGRKSVILFSEGFLPMIEIGGPTYDYLRSLITTANRSSVVFYTVDPRGISFGGLTAADGILEPSVPVTGDDDLATDAVTTASLGRRQELRDTQEGLQILATGTGGYAVKNGNDLSGGVRRILEDQNYYLVAYEPNADAFDPAKSKFNEITVKVTRPGARARYRSGFFKVSDQSADKTKPNMSGVAQMESALVSPFAVNGIKLSINALFANDLKNGSYVRSILHVDPAGLKFTDEANGMKKVVFDVLAMSFGDNGQVVDELAKGFTMTVGPDAYKTILSEGFVYHFAFPVKKPGAYQYRVALRDFQGGAVGSANQLIEVPDLKKKSLVLSSLYLENVAADGWKQTSDPNAVRQPPNTMADTALRRVKLGTVLRVGFDIYNAKLNAAKQPGIQVKLRLFRDETLVFDGAASPLDSIGQTDMQRLRATRAIGIGDKMAPGDYILQVVVTDTLAKKGQQLATQFVQFEVVE